MIRILLLFYNVTVDWSDCIVHTTNSRTNTRIVIRRAIHFVLFLAPPINVSNDLSVYEGQELSISERPELTAAKVVISGGEISLSSWCKHVWSYVIVNTTVGFPFVGCGRKTQNIHRVCFRPLKFYSNQNLVCCLHIALCMH